MVQPKAAAAQQPPYFNLLSYILSRVAFIGTHVVFAYWVLFMLNDPFNFGVNTVDPKVAKPAATCTPIIKDNVWFDLGLFALWWGTHSIFARKVFKQATGLWAHPLERPLFATWAWIVWGINVVFWRPITDCDHWDPLKTVPWVAGVAVVVFTLGAVLLVGLLWLLPDHVFGTGKCRFAPGSYQPHSDIISVFPYGLVRHPAAAGFLYMYWSVTAAAASRNHLFITVLWSIFIIIGTLIFEEGGLHGNDEFGAGYRDYRKKVNAFVPNPSSFARVFGGGSSSSKKRSD